MVDADFFTVQDEINLSVWRMAWMGWKIAQVGTAEACSSEKKFQLAIAPKSVEVPADHNRLVSGLDQLMQTAQLILSVAVFQGKMDHEKNNGINFCLDDKSFDALVKVVKTVIVGDAAGQYSVGLLIEKRDPVGEHSAAIFSFDHMRISQSFGYHFSLAASAGTIRA